MRRLVLEFSLKDLGRFGAADLIEKIELLEIIHYLKCDSSGFAGICRIRLRDTRLRLKGLVGSDGLSRVDLLSKEKDSQVVYMECKPGEFRADREKQLKVYMCTPIEFRGDNVKITAIGEAKEIRKLLQHCEKAGLSFRILSLIDAKFEPNSPLSSLTERQRRLLLAAYEEGYYEVPRKINSEELARKLKLDKSTVVEHLRKAEGRLLRQILES